MPEDVTDFIASFDSVSFVDFEEIIVYWDKI